MATKIAPKVEDRVIPQTSEFTPWLPVAIETPVQWTPAPITVKARMRSAGDGGVVYDVNPDHHS